MKRAHRDLLRHLPRGYRLVGSAQGHLHLYDPGGQLVRKRDGRPVAVPNTPGDNRYIHNQIAHLRREGLIR